MTQPAKRSFKRRFRVCYPPGTGTLVIRTELDWERDIHPRGLSSDGSAATFEIEAQQPFVHFKPCLIKNGSLHWAIGTNNLLIMAGDDDRVVYPFFFSDARGRFSPLVEVESAILDRHRRLRVYLPPGMRRTRWRVTRSLTCRTDKTCSFRTKHFNTRIGA
jgi:hypothetical protein